jgi:predicted metalloenzyme YecM
MQEKISIQTIRENDRPALKVVLQTVNRAGAILSFTAINGTMLRLVALPDGESVISLDKIRESSIHLKIETGYHTLLRQIEVSLAGQEISVGF